MPHLHVLVHTLPGVGVVSSSLFALRQPNVHATSSKRSDFSDLERALSKSGKSDPDDGLDDFSPQAAAATALAAAAAAASAPSHTGAAGWSKPLKRAVTNIYETTSAAGGNKKKKKKKQHQPGSEGDGSGGDDSGGGGVGGPAETLLSPELMAELGDRAAGDLVLPSKKKAKVEGSAKFAVLTPAETKARAVGHLCLHTRVASDGCVDTGCRSNWIVAGAVFDCGTTSL